MTETSNVPKRGRGRPAKAATDVAEAPQDNEPILIHFVEDGVTAFRYTWSAGQELEVIRGSAEYEQTLDLHGNSWLDKSEEAQLEFFGSVKWRKGESPIPNPVINYTPHPAERFDSIHKLVSNAGNTHLSLAFKKSAAEAEIARGRGIPVVS